MQPVEALLRLITIADRSATPTSGTFAIDPASDFIPDAPTDEQVQDQLAVSIVQAILNTALPIARFRVFVKIESGRESGREYVICAVNIEDVVAAIYPLTQMARNVYVTLWEQRATGAEMLEGYQGPTRTLMKKSFRAYLESMDKYSVKRVVN